MDVKDYNVLNGEDIILIGLTVTGKVDKTCSLSPLNEFWIQPTDL
jgi:hypothetical protein